MCHKKVDFCLLKTEMDTAECILLPSHELAIYTEDLSGDQFIAFIGLTYGKTLNSGIITSNQRIENLPLLLMVIFTFFLFFFLCIL